MGFLPRPPHCFPYGPGGCVKYSEPSSKPWLYLLWEVGSGFDSVELVSSRAGDIVLRYSVFKREFPRRYVSLYLCLLLFLYRPGGHRI